MSGDVKCSRRGRVVSFLPDISTAVAASLGLKTTPENVGPLQLLKYGALIVISH